jgi:hypothetical protein
LLFVYNDERGRLVIMILNIDTKDEFFLLSIQWTNQLKFFVRKEIQKLRIIFDQCYEKSTIKVTPKNVNKQQYSFRKLIIT